MNREMMLSPEPGQHDMEARRAYRLVSSGPCHTVIDGVTVVHSTTGCWDIWRCHGRGGEVTVLTDATDSDQRSAVGAALRNVRMPDVRTFDGGDAVDAWDGIRDEGTHIMDFAKEATAWT